MKLNNDKHLHINTQLRTMDILEHGNILLYLTSENICAYCTNWF